MRFYTRSGDDGETNLMHGKRVSKADQRIECLGQIDELSSFISLAYLHVKNEEVKNYLLKIQKNLYLLSSEIADPSNKTRMLKEEHLKGLEEEMEKMSSKIPPLKHFIIPGGSLGSSFLHVCRAICRRAERSLVRLKKKESINEFSLKYLNRLSSYFFVAALYLNKLEGIEELELKPD